MQSKAMKHTIPQSADVLSPYGDWSYEEFPRRPVRTPTPVFESVSFKQPDDDFESLFGETDENITYPFEESKVVILKDTMSDSQAARLREAFEAQKESPEVSLFYDVAGDPKILAKRPSWMKGAWWGIAIVVDHLRKRYAIICVPAAIATPFTNFSAEWRLIPPKFDKLHVDGSSATVGPISHLEVAYFIPQGAMVLMTKDGTVKDVEDTLLKRVLRPLADEHCIIFHKWVIYEVASLDYPGTKGARGYSCRRYGDKPTTYEGMFRGACKSETYKKLVGRMPAGEPLLVYNLGDDELIYRGDSLGVVVLQLLKTDSYVRHEIDAAGNQTSQEINSIPVINTSLGEITALTDVIALMNSHATGIADILLDGTIVIKKKGQFTNVTIYTGINAAPSRFDTYYGDVVRSFHDGTIYTKESSTREGPDQGYQFPNIEGTFNLAEATFIEKLTIGFHCNYFTANIDFWKPKKRDLFDGNGKTLPMTLPKFVVYQMDLCGTLYPVHGKKHNKHKYWIENIDYGCDTFTALQTYKHAFPAGTYDVKDGKDLRDWTFVAGDQHVYSCMGHTLPHFTSPELVKVHYKLFQEVCKKVADNISTNNLMKSLELGADDNVLLEEATQVVPTYELPKIEPPKVEAPKPAANVTTVEPQAVKDGIDAAIKTCQDLAKTWEVSQTNLKQRIGELAERADKFEALFEKFLKLEQALRESESVD